MITTEKPLVPGYLLDGTSKFFHDFVFDGWAFPEASKEDD
jgi:hypothetical protein